MIFTVFGGSGFIGGQLVKHLQNQKYHVYLPERGTITPAGSSLGHVIYAIGLTGDFRSRPYDTIAAHVSHLAQLMKANTFDSWLYLSSTRMYSGLPASAIANEQVAIPITPNSDSLYDLSKMLGESICLTHPSHHVRVARLSNVYGPGQSAHTFLGSILTDLNDSKNVLIHETSDSCKDYVSLDDILPLLQTITTRGKSRLYNVASGQLTTHHVLSAKLIEITGATIAFSKTATKRSFPPIDIQLVKDEFDFTPTSVLDNLPNLVFNFNAQHSYPRSK